MQTIQITQLSPDQFEEAIKKAIKSQLDSLRREINPIQPKEEYLSRKEVADLLKVELSTLHNWCKKGKLHRYGIGNRVYFLRSEIEKAMVRLDEL
jgi:excisionase family DNA binding protein